MSLIRPQIRAKSYQRASGLGFAGTADSFAVGSVTDSFQLRDDEKGAGDYIGSFIYRPGFATDDRIKPAGELDPDTGLLNHSGSDYADTTAGDYEIVGLMHPDELNDCIRRGMQRIYFPFVVPISPWTDGDMNAADASAYTGQDSGASSTKSALAANHHSGLSSLLVTDSGSGSGYTEPASVFVEPGDRFFHGAICKVNTAGASIKYQLWDKTNGTGIGTAITVTSRRFQAVMLTDEIPDACFEVAARLTVVTSSAVGCWDTLFAHVMSDRRLAAPDWLDAPFKLTYVAEAHYGQQNADGRYNAASQRYSPWDAPADYVLEPLTEDAAPRTLQVQREADTLPERPLWIHGRRPFSDLAVMDDETDSTEAPEALVMAAVLAEVAEMLWNRYHEDQWRVMWQENEQLLRAEQQARPPKVIQQREVTQYTPGGRR